MNCIEDQQYRQSLNERIQFEKKKTFSLSETCSIDVYFTYQKGNKTNKPSSSKLPYGIHLTGEPHQFLLLLLPVLLLLLCIGVTERTETYMEEPKTETG